MTTHGLRMYDFKSTRARRRPSRVRSSVQHSPADISLIDTSEILNILPRTSQPDTSYTKVSILERTNVPMRSTMIDLCPIPHLKPTPKAHRPSSLPTSNDSIRQACPFLLVRTIVFKSSVQTVHAIPLPLPCLSSPHLISFSDSTLPPRDATP